MTGLFLTIGKQGAGKTLYTVNLLLNNLNGRKVYSNIKLFNIDYTYMNDSILLDLIKNDINQLNDSIIILDEIHIYLDSRDFMKQNNRELQSIFSQLRKRNILILATTQYLLNVDVRIRRQIKNIFELSHISGNVFNIKVYDIDGYYSRYLHENNLDLSLGYKYYDTFEVIN